ncbi:HDOD domain-containing protein [Thiorhodovibrio frisius]|uniref:HDOD domain-containing protein n=1 Tax=Thiorhodovibrio frisius TaxID=631362 RepID=H8Z0D6_9GAMM|nr:HDOD domain-containing protein [Thiorhodovibrio frisius]EIC21237.1 HDOD domain-containing protein [Thiorhodovibrio frisius]WPL23813.1 HDOD domain protein [Thiorhodovibrio frisius]
MRGFWKKDQSTDNDSLASELKAAGKSGAFPDLAEPDVIALFNAAELVKFAAGEWPFSAAQLSTDLIILLSGRLELRSSEQQSLPAETIMPGDWIGDGDFEEPPEEGAIAALARSAGSAVVITADTFSHLEDHLQTYLILWMKRSAQDRLGQERKNAQSFFQNRTDLLDAMYHLRTERGKGFSQSPIAKKLFDKVPKLPLSSIELLNKMLDERTTRQEIVDMVAMDYSLTSNLLKAVNSPLYGLETKITNLNHAMLLLGHDQVYHIVMSESVRYSLPESQAFTEIHQRAVEISRIALAMALTQQQVKPAEIATIALLSEIGLVIVELLKSYNRDLSALFEHVDPAEMGAELLHTWNLPESLCKSLRYQYYPEFAPPDKVPEDVRTRIALLYLSRRMHQILSKTPNPAPAIFIDDYLQVIDQRDLGENKLIFERVLPRLRREIDKLPKSLANLVKAEDR